MVINDFRQQIEVCVKMKVSEWLNELRPGSQ